jgi:hypothetical protein
LFLFVFVLFLFCFCFCFCLFFIYFVGHSNLYRTFIVFNITLAWRTKILKRTKYWQHYISSTWQTFWKGKTKTKQSTIKYKYTNKKSSTKHKKKCVLFSSVIYIHYLHSVLVQDCVNQ